MYINADRFKEQNIPIPTNGWTWQEFHSAVKQVNKEPDHYGLGVNLVQLGVNSYRVSTNV